MQSLLLQIYNSIGPQLLNVQNNVFSHLFCSTFKENHKINGTLIKVMKTILYYFSFLYISHITNTEIHCFVL